jgi:hypothetical protein
MVAIDISTLTLTELRDLQNKVSDRAFIVENQSKEDALARKARLADNVSTLTNLLGPVNAPQSLNSIRGVLAFGDSAIAANPGQAVVLILKGLEQLTQTTLDLARTVSEQ